MDSGSVLYSCSRCEAIKAETIPQLAQGHAWEEISRTDATCTAAGSVVSRCTRCNETKTEDIPALDHAWEESDRTPPTCTDAGSVHRTCTRCGFSVSEEIPALGSAHTWEETSRTDATQTSAGSIEYTCTVCGAVRSERIPPLGLDLTMSGLLQKMSEVLTVSMDWIGAVAGVIAENPILLLAVVISFIGAVVVLFRRVLNL